MFVLSQIVYGNMALIFPSHFHGYNKNEIFADYWDHDQLHSYPLRFYGVIKKDCLSW
jgi:hypothetical protein